MSDILKKICTDKLEHVAAKKSERPLEIVVEAAQAASPTRGFIAALQAKADANIPALIAEIKKASPSRGLIREDFNPAELAKAYEAGGAACLSVLTDVPYFQGADDYLVQARAAVSIPALRKDFMLDPYQVFEARALGSDCILLIMAALSDEQAADLEATAHALSMDVLVEVHNTPEMERALKLKTRLIGINNRNLKTLEVDIATTEELAKMVTQEARTGEARTGTKQDDRLLVSESGLYTPEDLARMNTAGAKCFLIGEALMRQDDVESATRAILSQAA